jgi:hypothetical protein
MWIRWVRIRNPEYITVTFSYGSGCGYGSSDPYLFQTDPESDPDLDEDREGTKAKTYD